MNIGHTLTDFRDMREFFNELLLLVLGIGSQGYGQGCEHSACPFYQMYLAIPLHQQQKLCRLIGSMIHFGEMLEQSFEGEYIEEISDVVVFGHSMLDGSSPVWGPFSTHDARAVEPTPS